MLLAAVAFLAFVLLWLALEAFYTPAKAETLRIVPVVPTVPGIEAGPSAAPFYRRGPTVRRAPSAGILDIPEAPANDCGPRAFEVTSGRQSERGCYQAR